MLIKNNKTRTTTILLVIALLQGPILYYFTSGFFKLIGTVIFGLVGLVLTLILFIDILRHKSTNTKYHIIGLIAAFIFGLSTFFWDTPVEYMDFYLRKSERNQIVEDVKKGLPVAQNSNDIDIDENAKGIVSVRFYIDHGLLDHFSAFVYTNDPNEIRTLNSGVGPFGGGVVKKLDTNWYRVSY
jgi:hypothetical protein